MNNPLERNLLFLKVKKQNTEAYAKFYDLYVTRIYRYIYFKISSTSDAQDLTSEVFLRVWQCIREGRDIKNLNSFIYVVARNSVIDFYRTRAKKIETSIEHSGLENKPDENSLLEQQMVESELREVLSGLDNLKDEYKEIIVLKYLDGLSVKEIADILNKSQGAVRVLVHRALKALKENIHE